MTAEAPAEAIILEEPAALPRGRTRFPSRLAAKLMNFYHSNPRESPNRRRNLLKLSWFPPIFRPLGFRAQKAFVWGRRGYKRGRKPSIRTGLPPHRAQRTNALGRLRELGERVRGAKRWRRAGPRPAFRRPLPGGELWGWDAGVHEPSAWQFGSAQGFHFPHVRTRIQPPGGSAAWEPWRVPPRPGDALGKAQPQERAAIEALDRETMADITERLESIRSEGRSVNKLSAIACVRHRSSSSDSQSFLGHHSHRVQVPHSGMIVL